MARIKTVSEKDAQGPRLELVQKSKAQYGRVLPGIRRGQRERRELEGGRTWSE